MAEVAATVASVPPMIPANSNPETMQRKFTRWSEVLMAEVLSVFVPLTKIDDDPLLRIS